MLFTVRGRGSELITNYGIAANPLFRANPRTREVLPYRQSSQYLDS